MKTIIDTWPEITCDNGYIGNGPGGYDDLIETFGFHIIATGHDDNYQGDSFYLFRHPVDPARVGFLCFGWGSCSGCDAFEAAQDVQDLEDLQIQLYGEINWIRDMSEFRMWLWNDEIQQGKHYFNGTGFRAFRKKVGR